MRYRRELTPGASYFFTVNLANRKSDLLVRHIDALRKAFHTVLYRHPVKIIAIVILPEHLHAIWQLPPQDHAFSLRWALIKGGFSRQIDEKEWISSSRKRKGERGIWQRRYWEHRIRDDNDLARHIEYIHFNPVKHGHVLQAIDWPYSSIHMFAKKGWGR
jgi:putative transposase